MQRDDGLPRAAHLEQHEALGGEEAGVLAALAQDLLELGERKPPLALAAVGVAEVGAGGDPGLGVAADVAGDGERAGEHGDGGAEVVEVVEDDAELVEEEGVRLAQLVGGVEVLLRERHVVELQVLHPEEELRQVRALEEAGGRAVGGDGLVVLALGGEGVGEADPGGAEVGVHHRGFGEEAPRFGDLADAEVVDAHGEPGGGLVGVVVGEAVREEEEGVGLGQLVQAGKVERVDAEVVLVGVEDGGGNGEGFLEAALREEEVGFREEEVGILRKAVMGGEGFGGVGEFGRVLVFGKTRGVEHLHKLRGFLRCRSVFGRDGVEVERLEKRPLLIRRHERILHQLVECFEALNVYPDSILVAFLRSIKSVLLRKAYATQVAHRGFELDVRDIFSIPLFAHFYPVRSRCKLRCLASSIAQISTRVL